MKEINSSLLGLEIELRLTGKVRGYNPKNGNYIIRLSNGSLIEVSDEFLPNKSGQKKDNIKSKKNEKNKKNHK